METKRIAIACFIGGIICASLALVFSPSFLWLGMLAGFAGGYLSYEFRSVLSAIPRAWRTAKKVDFIHTIKTITKFFRMPHPVFYLTLILSVPATYWIIPKGVSADLNLLWSVPVFSLLSAIGISLILIGLSFIGYFYELYREKSTINDVVFFVVGATKEDVKIEKEKGKIIKETTYLNGLRWLIFGFSGIAYVFYVMALETWKDIKPYFFHIGRFFWHLFRLIHSQKRVLCGIDGMLGGTLSYILLRSAIMSFSQQIILVLFGGLLGAGLGVVNYEIVSKRILRLAPSKT